MIIDIDNSESARSFIKKITKDWFDIDTLYAEIKAESFTNSSNFWNITDDLISVIANHLKQVPQDFLNIFEERCSTCDAKIMGYHCTRHSGKKVFFEKGILPLSEETIKFPKNQKTAEAADLQRYRTTTGPGPYFFLSYKSAKTPNNHFCQHGPEVLLGCNGQQLDNISSESVPLIIHCAIPFTVLPDLNYYIFCILRAYFNFIDSEDDSTNLFDGWSIDLKGKNLKPKHIIKIEEL